LIKVEGILDFPGFFQKTTTAGMLSPETVVFKRVKPIKRNRDPVR